MQLSKVLLMQHAKPRDNALLVHWPSLLGSDCLGLDSVELDQLSSCLQSHSPRCLRLHPDSSTSQLPFAVSPVPWHSRGFWLDDNEIRPGAYLQYAAGDYYIQDASSMLAMTLCRIQPAEIVCDLCAAPGGKASGLLEQLAGSGFLLADEVIQSRLGLLESALCRTRLSNFATCNFDAQRLAEQLPEQFDCVLVDAPCSGQSMVGRDKQSAAAFSTAQVEHSAARQQRIINSAADLVRPGGRLVYSTCTFAVAENELVIEQFLQHHPDWQLDPMAELESWASPRLPGSYRLWPHRDKCDGCFAAALTRKGSSSSSVDRQLNLAKNHRLRWQPWPGRLAELEFVEMTADAIADQSAWQLKDAVHLFCNAPWPQLAKLCHAGIEIAQLHPKRIEPAYASAIVRLHGVQPRSSIELTAEQAVQYVRGESLSISKPVRDQSGPVGWTQVCWQGRPLSWGKCADGKLKNHFPKLLRNPGITSY
jgi:16S rRNA C967 or C1407 C5-methylase (RsmB/RsmF family)/NOL1/NOP2/fmu family ribosome biogenesis protein